MTGSETKSKISESKASNVLIEKISITKSRSRYFFIVHKFFLCRKWNYFTVLDEQKYFINDIIEIDKIFFCKKKSE